MSLHPSLPLDRPDVLRRTVSSTPESSISCAQEWFTVDGATTSVLFLAGEIDMHTDPVVLPALIRLSEAGAENVVVDLTRVSFCSVGGFGMLVETAHAIEAGGRHFALVARSAQITKVWALLWPDRSFSRHATLASAIATTRARRRAPSADA